MKKTRCNYRPPTYPPTYMDGKEILITGGTGSLGKEILNVLYTKYNPKGIRIYSRDEFKQWELKKLLTSLNRDSDVSFLLGDVRDRQRLRMAMNGVDIVYNTAAMKQVPACEYNPIEAIKTNIDGAINVIETSIDAGVSTVMHVSTDKAVLPINLYGVTKACAEKLFIHGNVYDAGRTKMSCCRYGNVLGSRGSIIPLFREQAKTGEISITHPGMTRFWIHLNRVANFIIRVSMITDGEEIFIPKMPSMKVIDIAEVVAPKARINEIGIRQGEKLHECLIAEEESERVKEYSDSYVIRKDIQPNEFLDGWTYTSNNNDWWMTKDELRRFLKDV